jgi:hypothetical protein
LAKEFDISKGALSAIIYISLKRIPSILVAIALRGEHVAGTLGVQTRPNLLGFICLEKSHETTSILIIDFVHYLVHSILADLKDDCVWELFKLWLK